MSPRRAIQTLVDRAIDRPRWTVAAVAVLAILCGVLALGLEPSSDIGTLVSKSSTDYQSTQTDERAFGGNAVIILVRESLPDLVESRDLGVLTELEACLAGDVAVPDTQLRAFRPVQVASGRAYGGGRSPCAELSRERPAQVVYGPGTFLNRAVAAVNTQISTLEASVSQSVQRAESAARKLALARGYSARQAAVLAADAGRLEQQQQVQQLATLALQSGISSPPSIDDRNFISQVVFDQTRGVNQPKARFSYLFPSRGAALIQVRLRANLSQAQVTRAITLIRRAISMKLFRLSFGGGYTVTGEPVVLNDLAAQVTGSIAVLLVGAVLVMALVLTLIFRGTLRLLPLAVALGAAAITFGLTALAGASLTMASIAVLPILIGLSVDYAIQFQSRARESAGRGARVAVVRAAAAGAPTIAAAALATATGFLALLLSPVPMVRGFGVLLVVGIAVAFLCTLTAGAAALVLGEAPREGIPRGLRASRAYGALRASWLGAREILGDLRARLPRPRLPARLRLPSWDASATVAALARKPGRVLAIGALLAAGGWFADTQTAVQSDITKLVPSSMPALRHLATLERVTGVSGEIDVLVRARDVATPQAVGWMVSYEDRLLSHFGYLETKGCAAATLCPALSLPDLFSGSGGAGAASNLTISSIDSLLSAVPSYFSQAVITRNRHLASLAFGIRLMPLARQARVIDYMNAQLHPPPGVHAELAGLPVLAADANSALSSSSRRLLTLVAGLLAVGCVLLALFRDRRRALVPLVPIVFATGWSALIVFAIGIPLNPMSATLGALVIAISTEFSVLLSERFGQERAAGAPTAEALERAYRSTGAAVLASGVTAIAGFGVLILSSITMLRDFGFVTLIDLTVSLAGVLLVLPAVLVVAERGIRPERLVLWPGEHQRMRPRLPRRRARAVAG
jgi:hydrophobe/amphiphile efflux-3 (HAE3) family protein